MKFKILLLVLFVILYNIIQVSAMIGIIYPTGDYDYQIINVSGMTENNENGRSLVASVRNLDATPNLCYDNILGEWYECYGTIGYECYYTKNKLVEFNNNSSWYSTNPDYFPNISSNIQYLVSLCTYGTHDPWDYKYFKWVNCEPNITNTSLSDYVQIGCNSSTSMVWEANITQYDANYCGSENTTFNFYVYNNSWSNTSFSDWQNETCVSEKMNQSKYLTQYDNYECGTNTTFYEYQQINNFVNTSWSDWLTISNCTLNNITKTKNLTQSDTFGCGNTTIFEENKTFICGIDSFDTETCFLDKSLSWVLAYGILLFVILIVWTLNLAFIKIPFIGMFIGVAWIIATIQSYGCGALIGAVFTFIGVVIVVADIILWLVENTK